MKRKVIKQGNDTLTITLPRKWCEKFGVKTGDEINVEENDNSLIISSDKIKNLTEAKISFIGLNQQLAWRSIYAAYRSGYDTIHISFDPHIKYKNVYTSMADSKERFIMSPIEVVQDAINGMQSMIIIEQEKDYCVVKDLSETTDKEFDNALRRIFFLIEGMGEDCLTLFNEKKDHIVKAIDVSDINVDKFSDYCIRVLNKKGYKKFNKTAVMYSIILILEFIADEYKRVARHILKLHKNNKALFSTFEEINKLFSGFHKFFYSFNNKNMVEVHEKIEIIENKLKNIKQEGIEIEIIHHIKKIKRFIVDLIQLKLEMEF